MNKKCIIAIDQGTTGSKVHAFNEKAKLIASSYTEFKQYYPQAAWVEHDPTEIWEGIQKLLLNTLEQIESKGYTKKDILGIGITNQRETALLWDKNTGKVLNKAIVWQCRRTAQRCKEIAQNYSIEKIRRKTGLILDAYFSATKIEWLLNNIPNARERAKNKNDIMAGTIDSWLLYKLTGRHATDYTNASRTLLFNIIKRQWDEELLEIFNIPANILPTVHNSAHAYGTIQSIDKLKGVSINSLIGDQQAALFGQLCVESGQAKNTYGTGCFLLTHTGHECIFSTSNLLTTLACDERGKPAFALEGSVFIGGSVMQWLRDQLNFFAKAEESETMIANLKDEVDKVVFVPAFSGLGAPHWDMDARGVLLGLTRDTSKAQIIRAALKSIALQSYDLVKSMEKNLSYQTDNKEETKIKTLKVDGGATANKYLMQYQADILNCNIAYPQNLHTTALGAAYLAGIEAGLWDIHKLQEFQSELSIFTSNMSEERRQKELYYWHKGIERAKSWN